MRLAKAFGLGATLGLCCSTLLIGTSFGATDFEPKPWEYDIGFYGSRAEFPEVEPNNTCPGQAVVCGDVVNPAAITPVADLDFYGFTVTAGTLLTLGTDAVAGQPGMDTVIRLYSNDCVTSLTSDDDSGPGSFSLISSYAAPYTGTYYLRVEEYQNNGTGAYKFFINCVIPQPPPVNDKCAGALVIDRCSSGQLSGTTAFALNDYGTLSLPCTGYTANGRDVVYVMTLAAGDIFAATYTQTTTDASFYLITDCSNPSGSCVAGADATLTGQPETFNYVATGGTYYLILDSYSLNSGGAWTMTYSITCPPPTGACCAPDGSCTVTTQAACQGAWQGPGTNCDPNLCPQPRGACCVDFVCTITTLANCAGQWYGPGSTCDPSPCPASPPSGACCVDFVCTITTEIDCAGQWYGADTTCDPSPCPPPPPRGACCVGFDCTITTEADCAGQWYGADTTCDPSPCPPPPPMGACCVGTDCVVVTAAECQDLNGDYMGDGSGCTPDLCNPVPLERGSWGLIKSRYRR